MGAQDDITIRVGAEFTDLGARGGVDSFLNQIQTSLKTTRIAFKSFDDVMKPINAKVKQLQMAKQPPFAGWAMSIMFLGMAMQNMFNRIWTTSSKVFDDVSHSVDGVVTGFDQLNMTTSYLGYELGKALEPIAMFLVPIVEAIANWVSENQGLTTGILAVVGGLGTLFSIIGSGVLAFNGFVGAWAVLAGWIPGVTTAIASFGASVLAVVTSPITLLITAFALVGTWLYKTQEIMGGWGNFFKNVLLGISTFVVFVTAIIAGAFSEAWKWVKVGWNGVVSFIQGGLNMIIGWLNRLISAFNAVTGSQIGTIRPLDMSGMQANTSGGFMDTYSSIMGSYADWWATQSPTQQRQQVTNNTTVNINGLQMPGADGSTTIDDLLLVLKRQ